MKSWKNLQLADAQELGLVANCMRMAAPASPDTISLVMAMRHIGVRDDLIETISSLIRRAGVLEHYGWYAESKHGYAPLPKHLKEVILTNKTKKKVIVFFSNDVYIATRRGSFLAFLHGLHKVRSRDDVLPTLRFAECKKPFSSFLIQSLEQAANYGKTADMDSTLQYPFVSWVPKGRQRYADGIAFMYARDLRQFLSEKLI